MTAAGRATAVAERVVLYALLAYPFLDFAFRSLPLPVLPGLWDEALLALGLALAARRRPWRPSPVLRPMGLFLAVAAAVALTDPAHPALGLEGLRAIFQYMLAFVIALHLTDDRRQVRRAVLVLVALGAVAALHGLYQYLTHAPMPETWVSVTESLRTRAYGIVGSPNGLGDYLALLVPLAVGAARCEAGWRRAALAAAALVLAAGLGATFSRGAWLALAGALALTLPRRLLAALVAGAVLVTLAVPPVTQRLGQVATAHYWERALVPGGRLYRWNLAYEQVAHAPLTGAGVGQWGGAVAARRLGVTYTDNYYAKTAAETGLPGLAAFLALMAACFRLGPRALAALAGRERALAAGLWGALLVVMLHNGVENIFEIPFLNAYFWTLAAFLSRLPELPAETPPGPEARPA